MNDTSSRSHCVTVFTLSVQEGKNMQQTRLQLFDLMGSERFKGGNAAHDESKSSKSTMSGFEGIFANLSLSALIAHVENAAKQRKKAGGKKKKKKFANPMLDFALTDLLQGSLSGSALTALVTCLSQAPRNGGETFLSLQYTKGMVQLTNDPKQQPWKDVKSLLKKAKTEYEKSSALVAKGVQGKYQALRQAQVVQWQQTVNLLENLEDMGGC